MSVLIRDGEQLQLLAKGAVEEVRVNTLIYCFKRSKPLLVNVTEQTIAVCASELIIDASGNQSTSPLTVERQTELANQCTAFAAQGLRVLAVARRVWDVRALPSSQNRGARAARLC